MEPGKRREKGANRPVAEMLWLSSFHMLIPFCKLRVWTDLGQLVGTASANG